MRESQSGCKNVCSARLRGHCYVTRWSFFDTHSLQSLFVFCLVRIMGVWQMSPPLPLSQCASVCENVARVGVKVSVGHFHLYFHWEPPLLRKNRWVSIITTHCISFMYENNWTIKNIYRAMIWGVDWSLLYPSSILGSRITPKWKSYPPVRQSRNHRQPCEWTNTHPAVFF